VNLSRDSRHSFVPPPIPRGDLSFFSPLFLTWVESETLSSHLVYASRSSRHCPPFISDIDGPPTHPPFNCSPRSQCLTAPFTAPVLICVNPTRFSALLSPRERLLPLTGFYLFFFLKRCPGTYFDARRCFAPPGTHCAWVFPRKLKLDELRS